MMGHKMKTAIQRTLILTLGEPGAAVGQRLVQMLDEWGSPPVVAVRHLGSDGATVGEAALVEVGEVDEVGEAPDAEVVDTALREISRLAHRATLGEMGYSRDRLGELVIWVVGPPDAVIADVARLAAERAMTLLGIDPFTLGLALWDNHPAGSPAEGPPNQNHDACTGPLLPSPPLPFPPLSLLYLAAPVNEIGLTLDDAPALYERAARFLALHICTPLCDTLVCADQAEGWGDGPVNASFGLTWIAWPGNVAQARAARQLAAALRRQLLETSGEAPDANALLREAALAPPLLTPRLTPLAATETVRSAADDVPAVAPWALLRPAGGDSAQASVLSELAMSEPVLSEAEGAKGAEGVGGGEESSRAVGHPLIMRLEATVKERVAALDNCGPAWERVMHAGIDDVIAHVRAWVAHTLDAAGLDGARSLIGVLERRLGEWAAGAEQRLEEAQEDLTRIEREGEAVRAALVALLEKMPRRRLGELLRLLRSPARWVWLWLGWRKAERFCARYLMFQTATLETRVVIEQMKRACGVYWAAGAELQTVSRALDRWEQEVYDLFNDTDDVPEWPRMEPLLGDDPDALLNELAERHLLSPQAQVDKFLAQWGPRSRWWREGLPNRKEVDEWLVEQVIPLVEVPVSEVVRCRHSRQAQPDALSAWVKELAAQASPLWRWDPAALSEAERAHVGGTTVVLSAMDGGTSWGDDVSGWRALPLARADRLAVVVLRWGIPFELSGVRD